MKWWLLSLNLVKKLLNSCWPRRPKRNLRIKTLLLPKLPAFFTKNTLRISLKRMIQTRLMKRQIMSMKNRLDLQKIPHKKNKKPITGSYTSNSVLHLLQKAAPMLSLKSISSNSSCSKWQPKRLKSIRQAILPKIIKMLAKEWAVWWIKVPSSSYKICSAKVVIIHPLVISQLKINKCGKL